MVDCSNCGDPADDRYHLILDTDEIVEMYLCGECRDLFSAAEWVDLVSE